MSHTVRWRLCGGHHHSHLLGLDERSCAIWERAQIAACWGSLMPFPPTWSTTWRTPIQPSILN